MDDLASKLKAAREDGRDVLVPAAGKDQRSGDATELFYNLRQLRLKP